MNKELINKELIDIMAKDIPTVEKSKRISWKFEGTILKLDDLTVDLAVYWPGWITLSELEQYVVVYGVKQACSDVGAGFTNFEVRQDAVKGRFQAFIDRSPDFLPHGRTAMTQEEKQEIQELNVQFLIASGLPEATAKLVAKASGVKKLYLIKTE